jgi:hypothetical protein
MLTTPLRWASINFVTSSPYICYLLVQNDRCSACAKPVHRSPRAQKCWGKRSNFVTQNLLRTRTVMNWFRTGLDRHRMEFMGKISSCKHIYLPGYGGIDAKWPLTNQPTDCC